MKEEFSQTADSVTQRVMKKAIGALNFLGNVTYLGLSAVQSGFVEKALQGVMDWNLLEHAYFDRPLPIVVSGILITGSVFMYKGIVPDSFFNIQQYQYVNARSG